jgi:pantoate--beta-alanine ligase
VQVARTIAALRSARSELVGRVGFVPTMGALHAGHLSLVDLTRQHADRAVVSIFVNPTQFDDPRDLRAYPTPLEDDLAKLEAAGVALAFCPSADEMYPPGRPRAKVEVPALADVLEGEHRPGHFAGVCEVVLKLFHLVRPDVAVFGRKDFQQLRIVEAMTAALDLPIDIVRGPIARDPDGLAMSSRNVRLSPDNRADALALPRALLEADASKPDVAAWLRNRLESAGLAVDYAAAVDPETLRSTAAPPLLLAAAVRVGGVRLIDNRLFVDVTP